MAYKIIATDEMNKLLDKCINYLLRKLKSEQAATHLLDGISELYSMLEINPQMYRISEEPFLKSLNYHEAKISGMEYIVVYKVVDDKVYNLGIFHTLENYVGKMKIFLNL